MNNRFRTATRLLVWAAIMGMAAHTATAADAPAAAVDDIVRNLGDGDFSVREAAEQQLEKLPPESLAALRAAEARTNDKEVIVRLRAAIAAVELRGLLHPPALSLDIKDASLGHVAKALNAQ